jgi:NADPH-dependent glutamate synthase beta subunit-like oxidoreductase
MTGCSANSVLLALTEDDAAQPHYVPPPCQVACPIGTDVGSYVGQIWQGDYAGALETITATNPFSGVCGRVCDAPCEPACRRASGDGAVTIRLLKRYVLDKLGASWTPPRVEPTKDRSVAIVGAGPAGLTAAQDIAQAGYSVHVFEAAPKAGGMMIWGIPDFRLPPAVVEQDIKHILQRYPGIHLHLSTPLGDAVTLDELTRQHAAVLLAIGANAGKRLGIPGDDLPGVVDGLSFLSKINGGDRPTLPETVLVIGGGDVAMDACRTARRLPGVRRVQVLYRRGPAEIPARQHELDATVAEGIDIAYNTLPVSITSDTDGMPILRVVATTLGDPDPDGRRRPVAVADSERDISAGLIIAAVGQKSVSRELARHGLMGNNQIDTDTETMRTRLPTVYSAGDAAFGSSTLVSAMAQGHKAAYYVLAQLEGIAFPQPYHTPHRTRAVAVAQDIAWEKLAPNHPTLRGVDDVAQAFAESEPGYDEQVAHEQAARCYRCDTETGSADYTVKLREAIFEMVGPKVTPLHLAEMTRQRLTIRDNPFPPDRPAGFDDLTFLPANLTRLVIDPYREACKTTTTLADGLTLAQPLLVGGFDELDDTIRAQIAAAIVTAGTGYLGQTPIAGNVPWLQLLNDGAQPDPRAKAVIQIVRGRLAVPMKAHPDQLTGLAVTASNIGMAVPFALEHGIDLLILDGTGHIGTSWSELASEPDLGLISQTIHFLRAANAEESIGLIYFGGLRSGSDLAKALALGGIAGVAEAAVAFAAGAVIEDGHLAFPPQATSQQRTDAVANFLKAVAAEASMMARCTGKTDVHNLEPEDLRSLTLAAQRATGIVLAGAKPAA